MQCSFMGRFVVWGIHSDISTDHSPPSRNGVSWLSIVKECKYEGSNQPRGGKGGVILPYLLQEVGKSRINLNA